MAKVFEAGMKGFPPRLPEQSIFYPVLVQEYADQTAATWNTKEEPFVGYVIEMEILDEYGARFTPQTVGSAIHRELWVPSEELAVQQPAYKTGLGATCLLRAEVSGARAGQVWASRGRCL